MKAKIHVLSSETVGQSNCGLYGMMIENCGRCVYDGLWVGPESATPNRNGIRSDVLTLLESFRPTIIRWPGGTPSETYHWRDGVGPREKRPESLLSGTCFNSPGESNAFGTDEYLWLCDRLGSKPYVCVNVSTGSAEEAANWVEYCNRSGKTTFAKMRAENGRVKPYGVQFWGLGNESYFWYDDPADYAQRIKHYVKTMKLVDPRIRTVAAGWRFRAEWNRSLLELAARYIDFISVHFYYGMRSGRPNPVVDTDELRTELLRLTTYEDLVAGPYHAEQSIRELVDLIQSIPRGDQVRIAMDEWTVWHEEATAENGGCQNCTLQDGIFAAGMLHMMYRMNPWVEVSVLSNMVNSTCAVVTEGDRVCASPVYHVLQVYSNHAQPTIVRSRVEVDSYPALGVEGVPYLDCLATTDRSTGLTSLAVINRHRSDDIESQIAVDGLSTPMDAKVCEINALSVIAVNDFEQPNRIRPDPRSFRVIRDRFTYTFPAHSVTVIDLQLA